MKSQEYGINLGILIREAMKIAGLTQRGLAEKVGCSLGTMRNWQNGVYIPDAYSVSKIQRVTGSQIDISGDYQMADSEAAA